MSHDGLEAVDWSLVTTADRLALVGDVMEVNLRETRVETSNSSSVLMENVYSKN